MNRKEHISLILKECEINELNMPEQKAYVLATAEWETAHTMKPVKEAFWLSEDWRRRNLRYYPFYGRGYVQLTWETNYKKYSDIMNEDFVKNPDKVMEPEISAFILCHGFKNGSFTGHTLEQWVNLEKMDFMNARRCINGTDKAIEIADLAGEYLKDLGKGKYDGGD